MRALLARYALLGALVVVLNFALPRLLPGDPLAIGYAGGLTPASASTSSVLTPTARQQLRASYHLDEPLPQQFVSYLGDLSQGNLGWSISQATPVSQLIQQRLPWTLALVVTSLVVASAGGLVLGLFAAWHAGRWDRVITSSALALAAVPEVLLAVALLLGLAVGLHLFPLQGGQTLFLSLPVPTPTAAAASGGAPRLLREVGDVAWHLALPALTLVLANTAAFVSLTRGVLRGILGQPYLLTARAKGLSERQVAFSHAAPNALLPLLTIFGLRLGQVLGGAIVVERVFSIPGLGLLAYNAIGSRDYPVLQAVFLLASLAVLAVNLALDLVYRRWGGGPWRAG